MQTLTDLVDCIGIESCVDMKPDFSDVLQRSGPTPARFRIRDFARPEKEYPPPMQPPATVLRRCQADDGRLVIVEERLERLGQFRAHRSGGRLVLNLLSPMIVGKSEDIGGDGVVGGDTTADNALASRECGGLAAVAGLGLGQPVLT
ncbi:Protein of unknown function (DUF3049 [Striga hermonthica]|uniref:FAF domain-containing protein n=1 Tax=Striga hermonthica TaxID=68872 RepID=A0A9N7NKJ1_STRHE|nr:Protein of unknown function (DUF3049 [Striga hermonthica]